MKKEWVCVPTGNPTGFGRSLGWSRAINRQPRWGFDRDLRGRETHTEVGDTAGLETRATRIREVGLALRLCCFLPTLQPFTANRSESRQQRTTQNQNLYENEKS